MTNGTVTTATGKLDGKELAVSYKGQKAQVLVSTNVPTARFVPRTGFRAAIGCEGLRQGDQDEWRAACRFRRGRQGRDGVMPAM